MGHAPLGTVDYHNRLRDVKLDEIIREEVVQQKLILMGLKLENQVKLEEAQQVFFLPGPQVQNQFQNQGRVVQPMELEERPAVMKPATPANNLRMTMVIVGEEMKPSEFVEKYQT